ncbi:hypothetical protein DFJ69_0300 [Thermomonospora umbrina]|uniref:Uncharacterized protein n=2 Tax=Thermomonospora umbrina TaxID=111806 RepID=A0A3D9STA4_9ACTN|nr:hypothetical protein DFJ69_0300 [Thermomonospora umbrina]
MMRRTAVAGIGLLALTGLATPAHAQTACTVNGTPASGTNILGTAGNDVVSCSHVDQATIVDTLAGDDRITVTGQMNGRIRAGDGADGLTVTGGGSIGVGASLDGQMQADRFEIQGAVLGDVRGGQDNDTLRLTPTARVAAGADVRGARGVDTITVDQGATVLGVVEGNQEGDTITVATVGAGGRVHGDEGDDSLTVRSNQGTVDGGVGNDTCRVGGVPPVNCETVTPPS